MNRLIILSGIRKIIPKINRIAFKIDNFHGNIGRSAKFLSFKIQHNVSRKINWSSTLANKLIICWILIFFTLSDSD